MFMSALLEDPRPSAEQRVAYLAGLLDRTRPGWERKIDLERLDMRCSDLCVLGQSGGYSNGLRELQQLDPVVGRIGECDFVRNSEIPAWRAEIEARLGANPPTTFPAWWVDAYAKSKQTSKALVTLLLGIVR